MTPDGVLRADLHVHSYHSGYASHLGFLRARDCYSEPEAVYRTAKARGMDLVTITDHDSIGGCLEFLEKHPGAADFFMSEEVSCRVPDLELKVHLGAYGIDERIHHEVQRLRPNLYEAAEYLRREGVFVSLNHPFFFFRRQMTVAHYVDTLVPLCAGIELRNGAMLPEQNALVGRVILDRQRAGAGLPVAVAGSDAHTLRAVGTTYTEAPGRSREDFFDSLRAGRTRVAGRHGGPVRIASEIYGVILRYWMSLLGFGRQDLTAGRRAVGLAWSVASLPAEFVPALVAVLQKRGESRRVAAYRSEWHEASTSRLRDSAQASVNAAGHPVESA